jgi:hypothetical protein
MKYNDTELAGASSVPKGDYQAGGSGRPTISGGPDQELIVWISSP